ncbi:MAG TPA: DUF2177 family protein [Candidatus Saccharibacteria bacterium]|jgi:uncharacterized membrane protein|nr:DUF2177 family protein [Candidatus Saccharibacteria bacterium]
MNYIFTFLGSALTFLGLDVIWIKFIAKPELEKIASGYLKIQPNTVAAVLFYVIYLAGVLTFTIKLSNSPKQAAFIGFGIGLLAYATYELTNMATLANWSWKMVILDTAWGGILTTIASVVGYLIYAKLD